MPPERKRVTLITVFPYPDGTIISADSQETVRDRGNEYKYSVLKLKPQTFGKFQVVFAGGGNGDAIETLIEDCQQSFSDTTLESLPALKKALQAKIQECRKELRALGENNQMHLLIAAHIDTNYAVWKTTSSQLRDVTEPDMIGFTDFMYRHTVKEFHPASLPATQLILLSLRVLDFARQTSTCVDQPYSVIVVQKDGIHVFDPELVKQFTQSIAIFGASVNRLLLACGDTSIDPDIFQEKITEFTNTATYLRDEYMQQVGQRIFQRMLEPGVEHVIGDPVSLIPSGSKIDVAVDKDGQLKTTVSKEPKEEREKRQEMMRWAEAQKEELRQAQEKLAKLIDGRTPLYEGRERVLLRPARPRPA